MSGTDDTRQHSEQGHADQGAQLAHATARAEELQKRLDAAERRCEIDAALLQAQTIDLETARLLAEHAMGAAPGSKAAVIVAELRRRKPFLFRAAPERGAAMAPEDTGAAQLRALVAQARASGDRRALLRYLRARRAE